MTWFILGIAIGAFVGSLAAVFFVALGSASKRAEFDGAVDRFADYVERLALSKKPERQGEAVNGAMD